MCPAVYEITWIVSDLALHYRYLPARYPFDDGVIWAAFAVYSSLVHRACYIHLKLVPYWLLCDLYIIYFMMSEIWGY